MQADQSGAEPTGQIEQVASGQKLVITAIVLNGVSVALNAGMRGSADAPSALGLLPVIVGLGAVVLSIVGLLRLGSGLGFSVSVRILLVILAFVPLVNLVMLVMVNSRATAALRAAGYRVGLFGAEK